MSMEECEKCFNDCKGYTAIGYCSNFILDEWKHDDEDGDGLYEDAYEVDQGGI